MKLIDPVGSEEGAAQVEIGVEVVDHQGLDVEYPSKRPYVKSKFCFGFTNDLHSDSGPCGPKRPSSIRLKLIQVVVAKDGLGELQGDGWCDCVS